MKYQEVLEFMQKIQEAGYAVAIFTPEELKNVAPKQIELEMISAGFDTINYLSEENEQ